MRGLEGVMGPDDIGILGISSCCGCLVCVEGVCGGSLPGFISAAKLLEGLHIAGFSEEPEIKF